MGAAEKTLYPIVEYLELEDRSQEKHEYHDGYIIDMAGGTAPHSKICNNVSFALTLGLKDKKCSSYNSDLKILAEKVNSYYYPDASVICGELEFDAERKDIVKNPTVIVEVLSKSTALFDRTEKFWNYRTIPTFKEYVLISQDKPLVEVFCKNDENKWVLTDVYGLEDSILLESIGVELKLEDVFDKVDFEESETEKGN
ncbi:MAG: Uma2 family endonuclease [Arenicella sp.]|jgi:Uma2 family endonuclease